MIDRLQVSKKDRHNINIMDDGASKSYDINHANQKLDEE